MGTKFLSEVTGFRTAIAASADLYDGDPSTDAYNMGTYQSIAFVVNHGAGATGTAVVTVEAIDNAAADNPVAIAFKYRLYAAGAATGALTDATATGFTIAAGANQIAVIEIESDMLPDGKPFVQATFTEGVDSAVAGCVMAVLSKPRHTDGDPPAGIS